MSGEKIAPLSEGVKEPKKKLTQSPYFWATLAGLIAIPMLRPLTRRIPPPPPSLGAASAFVLHDQLGVEVTDASLRGKPTVMYLFYADCGAFCDMQAEQLKSLRERYKREDVGAQLIGVSVDPARDTAKALEAFAQERGFDWPLLTGDLQAIEAITKGTFRPLLGLQSGGPEGRLSAFFVLIDAEGQIRGYYDSTSDGVDEVYHRTKHLLRPEGS